ncbi:MAG: hypothetical protein QM805_05065 [Pseudomonas sp.]
MTLWRMAANNTHLYPGALLRCQDAPGGARLARGDEAAVELADGSLALGTFSAVDGASAALALPAFRTRRGALVAARTWRLVPGGEAGLLRVKQRLG